MRRPIVGRGSCLGLNGDQTLTRRPALQLFPALGRPPPLGLRSRAPGMRNDGPRTIAARDHLVSGNCGKDENYGDNPAQCFASRLDETMRVRLQVARTATASRTVSTGGKAITAPGGRAAPDRRGNMPGNQHLRLRANPGGQAPMWRCRNVGACRHCPSATRCNQSPPT